MDFESKFSIILNKLMANCFFLYLGGFLKIPEYDQHSTKAQRRDNACVLNMTSQIIRIARDDKKKCLMFPERRQRVVLNTTIA